MQPAPLYCSLPQAQYESLVQQMRFPVFPHDATTWSKLPRVMLLKLSDSGQLQLLPFSRQADALDLQLHDVYGALP